MQVEDEILEALQQSSDKGLDDTQLAKVLPLIPDEQRIQALNSLIQKSRIQVLQRALTGIPYFKFVSKEVSTKLKDLSAEEQSVYQCIEESGNLGVLPSALKYLVAGQQITRINAILKKLATKGLIKTLTSVLKGGKKVWMLLEIEPSVDVTGGMTGSDYFDIESVAVVMEKVEAYTRKQGQVSKKELLVYIKQLGVLPGEKIRDDDIDQVLNVMVLDQKLEKVGDLYKAANWDYPHKTAYLQTPCADCLLKEQCGPQNRINPQTCEYMQDWLSQF